MCVKSFNSYLPLAQVLHDLVRAAAYDALLAVHDCTHQPIFSGHKSLLQVKSFVIPRDDATPQLEPLPYTQSPAVADGGCPHDHWSFECSQSLKYPVAYVEGEAGKVTLPQVTGIVHVAHVDVMGADPACEGLLCCDVPDLRLEPGSQDHSNDPEEVPHIQGAEENQQGGEQPQQPPHCAGEKRQRGYCDVKMGAIKEAKLKQMYESCSVWFQLKTNLN